MMFSFIVVFLSAQSSHAFSVSLMCPHTHPNEEVGICYEDCESGYSGVLAVCMKDCSSGWTEVGPSCNRWNSDLSCKWCYSDWGIPYPCCSGGWEVQVRNTKTRNAKEMMVTFSVDSGLENELESFLEATKPITEENFMSIAENFLMYDAYKNGNFDYILKTHESLMRDSLDLLKSDLKNAYKGLKSYSMSWVEDAVGAAFALYDTIEAIGRRRLELHGAGEHSSQTGKPVVLIDEDDEFVEELADGTLKVMITRERLDNNLMKMLAKELGEDMRAAGKSDDEANAALAKLVGDLKAALFVEQEGKSGSMSIEEYFEGYNHAEAVLGRLEEESGVEESADRRRLAASSIANCENSAFMVTVGGEASIGSLTAFVGVGAGISTCGLGFYGTAGYGGYIAEGAGVPIYSGSAGAGLEVFAAFDVYLKGKYIAGEGKISQIGFDVPEVPGYLGPEPFGLEIQLMYSSSFEVTGFGITVSSGFGVFPVSITPIAETHTVQWI